MDLQLAVLGTGVVPFIPSQPLVVVRAAIEQVGEPFPLYHPDLASVRLPAVEHPAANGDLHSRSPGDSRL